MSSVIIITPNKDGLEGNCSPAVGWLNLPEKGTKNKIRYEKWPKYSGCSAGNKAEKSAFFIFLFSAANINRCLLLKPIKKTRTNWFWSSYAFTIKGRISSGQVLVAVVRFSTLAVDKKKLFFPCLIQYEPWLTHVIHSASEVYWMRRRSLCALWTEMRVSLYFDRDVPQHTMQVRKIH